MMLLKRKILLIAFVIFLCGCNSSIATLYLNEGGRDELRSQAMTDLYDFYMSSSKNKKVYEVMSNADNGHYILNYDRQKQLLTVCIDPGSGWIAQFKQVNESKMRKLSELKLSVDDLIMTPDTERGLDTLLIRNNSWINVKTNGYPSFLN